MIKNILFLVLTYIIPFCVYAQFSSETVKRIDVIENNSASNITLSPDSSVVVDNFTGSFALQSGASGELQESSVSSTELGYLSGVTSLLQGQLDAKIDEPSGSAGGDILFYNGVSSKYARLAIGASNYVLTATPAGVPNWLPLPAGSPTTTAGDIIYNDAGGTATDTRLPIGSESQVLTVSSGLPSWQDAADPSPTTTLGDLIRRGASADERLGIGTEGQVLTVSSGQAEWEDLGESVSVTTKGDLQTYSTTPDRLPVGTDGQFLVADSAESTGLKWSDQLQGKLNPVTDWVNGSCGDSWSGTAVTCKYKIVGDDAKIQYDVLVTGGGASGSLRVTIPTGLTVNENKLLFNRGDNEHLLVSDGYAFDDSANTSYYISGLYQKSVANQILLLRKRSDNINLVANSVSNTAPFTASLDDEYSLTITVPINEFSSGLDTVVANQAIATGVLSSAGTQNVAAGNTEKVSLANSAILEGGFTVSSNELIVPKDGNYIVSGMIGITNTSGEIDRRMNCLIRKNNSTTLVQGRSTPTTNGGSSIQCVAKIVSLNAGDAVGLYFTNDGTTTQGILSGDQNTYLSIREQTSKGVIAGTFESTKWECQSKYLSSDITGDTNPITSLTMNNMTIGKKYQVVLSPYLSFSSADNVNFESTNGGSIVCDMTIGQSAFIDHSGKTCYFTATATTLLTRVSSLTGATLAGNGTLNETSVTICELPDNYVLNSTKFN